MNKKIDNYKLTRRINFFSKSRTNFTEETDEIFYRLQNGIKISEYEEFLLLCNDKKKCEVYNVISSLRSEIGKSLDIDDLEYLIEISFSNDIFLKRFVLSQLLDEYKKQQNNELENNKVLTKINNYM